MSGSDTDIQWFIARDGKQHGPVSDLEINKLVELGHLKATDLVWRQGFPDWRKALSVFPAVGEAAPSQTAPNKSPAAPSPDHKKGSAPGSASGPSAGHPAPSAGQAALQKSNSPADAPTGRPSQPQHLQPQNRPASNAPGAGPEARRGPGPAPGFGDVRPDPITGRPAGAPQRGPAQPMPGPGPGFAIGPRPDQRLGAGPGPSAHDTAAPTRRRKAPLVLAGLLVMGGLGAWLGSQYTEQIFAVVQPTSEEGTETETGTVTANLAPDEEKSAPAAKAPEPPAAPAAPTFQEVDRSMQQRPIWASIKEEFPEWYQSRVAEVARLSGEEKSDQDITSHLVTELVKLRRENAKHALAASTSRHRDIAAAFLANLRELASEGGDGCYQFISRGEASSIIVSRMQDPARSKQIEAQIVAIVAAISEGRKQPAEHTRPVKADYDLLAGELGRLGWTQADMRLFANPQELAKAPHDRVCSMLQDWFAAHLAIQDTSSQQRLLFETLKPVISG